MNQQVLKHPGQQLGAVLEKCQQLTHWEHKLKPLLPNALRDHVHVNAFRDGCLLLTVSAPLWATQLKYLFPELQESLQQLPAFKGLKQLNCKITPDPKLLSTKPPAPKLSAHSGQHIDLIADNISDPALKAALKRLAKRAQR